MKQLAWKRIIIGVGGSVIVLFAYGSGMRGQKKALEVVKQERRVLREDMRNLQLITRGREGLLHQYVALNLLDGQLSKSAKHGHELDATVLADYQDTLGGIGQHRGVEGSGSFQLLGKCLQFAAIVLMLQQALNLVAQHSGIERFEHEVHGASAVASQHGIVSLRDGRNEDDRGVAGARVAAHQARHFKTVDAGHQRIHHHRNLNRLWLHRQHSTHCS